MLEFTVLGSGSRGNCAVARWGDAAVLIDAGLSTRQILRRLELVGIDPASLVGILLTHEHSDHTNALDVLCRQWTLPVYCNPLTREALIRSLRHPKQWRLVETGERLELSGLRVETFSITHDAVDPIGFVLEAGGARLGVLSDVGHVTNLVRQRLRGVHTLFVEANYHEPLLDADTKRPWATKQRIASRHGHLSNGQVAELLRELAHPGLNRVVLGHLSEDCNCPDLARKSAAATLLAAGASHTEVACACQGDPTPMWSVVRAGLVEVAENAAELAAVGGGFEAAEEPARPGPGGALPAAEPVSRSKAPLRDLGEAAPRCQSEFNW